MYWKLAKVEEVYPGQDDIVRAPKVWIPKSGSNHTNLVRPIQHLHPLEINQTKESTEAKEKLF